MNWDTVGYVKIQSSPLYTTRSGLFAGGSLGNQASIGFLWSGTTGSDTYAYNLDYNNSSVYPASNGNRQRGFPVRCITRDFNFLLVQYGIAVNYVGASSDATWVISGYNNVQANPIYIIRTGCFGYPNAGSFYLQASDGYVWSGTTYSGTDAYYLDYNSSNVYPAVYSNRQHGFPVRCIA